MHYLQNWRRSAYDESRIYFLWLFVCYKGKTEIETNERKQNWNKSFSLYPIMPSTCHCVLHLTNSLLRSFRFVPAFFLLFLNLFRSLLTHNTPRSLSCFTFSTSFFFIKDSLMTFYLWCVQHKTATRMFVCRRCWCFSFYFYFYCVVCSMFFLFWFFYSFFHVVHFLCWKHCHNHSMLGRKNL